MDPSFSKIEAAAKLLKDIILRTPTIYSPKLSQLLEAEIYLKLENLQITGSFKSRGTYVKLHNLTAKEKAKGVIAMSAGNHAQGVAYHSQKMGIPAIIVMPIDTPLVKVQKTLDFGAKVILEGETLKEAGIEAEELVRKKGYTLIHPYDDPSIIVGQGTIALEMFEDIPDMEVLIAPIGGGGLMAGCAIVAKHINSSVDVIGVQSRHYPYMAEALGQNIQIMPGLPTLAEGIAVKVPGKLTRQIIQKLVDKVVLVSEEKIEKSIYMLAVQQKIVAEGAGAAGVAAAFAYPENIKNKKVGIVICGGNIDARILSSILMRGLVHEGKLVRFIIEIRDTTKILAIISNIIDKLGGNIIEIHHQRLFNEASPKNADLELLVETRNHFHAQEIQEKLQDASFVVHLIYD